jgi:hypothetical protein
MPQTAPFVFLSHSSADTEAAWTLKRRLEAAPEAQKARLKVWFDKDDLRPGKPWSAQIAQAIQTHATAFVVYVGSGGVMNRVEAEVDLALSRATTDERNPLLFIPALAADSAGSKALPPFAKRYQGVRDPLSDSEELTKLLKAILNLDWDSSRSSSTSRSSAYARCMRKRPTASSGAVQRSETSSRSSASIASWRSSPTAGRVSRRSLRPASFRPSAAGK